MAAGDKRRESRYTYSKSENAFAELQVTMAADRPQGYNLKIHDCSAGGLGVLVALYAGVAKLVRTLQAAPFRAYPGLMFAALLVGLGLQFAALGLLGEMVARTYYEAQGKPVYAVRRVIEHRAPEETRG